MSSALPRDRKAVGMAAVAVAAGVFGLAHWLAYRPGIMVWDSIRQYGQALSGRYDDWHPPAMNWLWRQLTRFEAGPAPMLVLQLLLYWGGIGLLAMAAARRGRRWLAAAIVGLGLLPQFLLLEGTILKDSLMAGCLLAAAAILAWRPSGMWPRIAVAVLLGAAATLRFNAVPAILPLALAAMPPQWIRTGARRIGAGVAVTAALLGVMPLANRLLEARSSGVEYSLITYDLGGITYYNGADAFPPMPSIKDAVAINAGCYNSISWDRYAWWGDAPCAIGFDTVRAAFRANGKSATSWWLRAIASHPVAYARHRLGHFNRNIRFWTTDSALPALSLKSDPNDWNLKVEPNGLSRAIDHWAMLTERTPLGWPACWIALAAAILAFWPEARSRGIAAPLLWSGLLYGLSFLPLSVASEARYHLWTMLAVGLGSLHMVRKPPAGFQLSPAIFKIGSVVVAVTALCVAARLPG